jgi:hypothetical protein
LFPFGEEGRGPKLPKDHADCHDLPVGGKTLLLGAVPATKRDGLSLGKHIQSTTLSEKCLVSGHTNCHHGANSQRGISTVARPFGSRSALHTFPSKL